MGRLCSQPPECLASLTLPGSRPACPEPGVGEVPAGGSEVPAGGSEALFHHAHLVLLLPLRIGRRAGSPVSLGQCPFSLSDGLAVALALSRCPLSHCPLSRCPLSDQAVCRHPLSDRPLSRQRGPCRRWPGGLQRGLAGPGAASARP